MKAIGGSWNGYDIGGDRSQQIFKVKQRRDLTNVYAPLNETIEIYHLFEVRYPGERYADFYWRHENITVEQAINIVDNKNSNGL